MIQVDYLLTISSHFLKVIANGFSRGFGEDVIIKDNGLVFPPGLAEGRFECHNINSELSITLIDCKFLEEVNFKRLPIMINYFHTLSFNLSVVPFSVESNGEIRNNSIDSWNNKILYSTSENGLGWTAPKNSHIKMVVFYFTRSWLQKNYKIDTLPSNFPYAEELMKDLPLQVAMDIDLKLVLILQEILNTPAPKYMTKMYYEGCSKKIISLIASRLTRANEIPTQLSFQDVIKITDIEKRIERISDQPLPSVEELAQECFMSKPKFEKLFKDIYNKSFTEFLHSAKMKKAEQLLVQKWDIDKIAMEIGYVNQNHFIKVFKSYYKTTPKAYQTNLKKRLRKQL